MIGTVAPSSEGLGALQELLSALSPVEVYPISDESWTLG